MHAIVGRAMLSRSWGAAAAGLGVALALVACGGSKPAARSAGDTGGGGDEASGGGESDDPDMIGVERMDEIKQTLDRRRTAAARCFADVVNDGKVDKSSRGHLALEFVISRAGRATNVKVLEDSLSSPDLEQCVIEKVEAIEFGELPKPLEWSYTFAFETM